MKHLSIDRIDRVNFTGPVYNLELESKADDDDLFWVEQKTGVVTHNCFPKDICSLIAQIEATGFDPLMLKAVWEQNLRLRPEIDWQDAPGAVSSRRKV
jgi:hypothetical protein